jgi:pimeloyl-ACP methyl ester carboxylesterase
VLLTHGLNSNPESFAPLAQYLSERGFEVFRPSFSGHRNNNQELLRIRSAQWEEDARVFYAEARARANTLKVPLHHVAYSMSGLIFQSLRDELEFDRRVYIAPALAFHSWYTPLIAIARVVPWIEFRSRIPKGYGANPRSGVRTVVALDDFRRKFRRFGGKPDVVPTLVWADPRDELVHGAGLRKLSAQNSNWEFRELNTDGGQLKYHHLCIDEVCLGAEEWKRFAEGTAQFLAKK